MNPSDMNPIDICDEKTGTAASILPELGFNCFQFSVERTTGRVPVLWADPAFAAGLASPDASGIPILFPFVGRLPGNEYRFAGKTYRLNMPANETAIHGFVLDRPWRVIEQTHNSLTGQFQLSLDAPDRRDEWPADFELTQTYRVESESLFLAATIRNPGQCSLPFGFGWHPYLMSHEKLDAAAGASLAMQPQSEWEMPELRLTGNKLPCADAQSFAAGFKIRDRVFDNIYTEYPSATGEQRIVFASGGEQAVLKYDTTLPHCVVYTPPHRAAICIEPWSSVPDFFRLEHEGVATGLQLLAPGEQVEFGMSIQSLRLAAG